MVSRRSQLWLRCVSTGAIVAVLSLSGVASAGAAAKGPTDFLKGARADLDKILTGAAPAPGSKEDAARDAKLTTLVRGLFDFRELGIRALGANWAARTDGEREEFVKTLSALIEKNYLMGVKATGPYTIKYLGEEIAGTQASVKTEITTTPPRKKKPLTVAVEYKLVKDAKGEWRVYDIITDGDSTVDLYKAEFNKVIATDGFAGLMKKLRTKLDSYGPGSSLAGSGAPTAGKP
ncbi:MAG TPA: ABC transporter substrate-binding protein [Myxococcota bacterium]|jgi:phospholipid transport system substrate-binding protein|nr:ABC transporter substrate-binding protein [Myxococcota bacterium]